VADDASVLGSTTRLLIKVRPSEGLGAAASRIDLQPLHETAEPGAAFAAGASPRWFVAQMPEAAASSWDLAHERVADQLGVAASDVVFVEPDILHDVYRDTPEEELQEAFTVGKDCRENPQDGEHGKAVGPDLFAWHLGDDFTELGKARESVQFTAPRTRIAHIDTGYDAEHETVPEEIQADLAKNFVGDPPDPHQLKGPSTHGTGTLGILAGNKVKQQGDVYLGGAPQAEVVPLRVADSVVLLRTSAFVRALRYAVDDLGCDVATMSLGGLPSRAWAEEVDRAYEHGLCLCAAAGNHFAPLPPKVLVYPARYSRVLAVCGVMADGRPYEGLSKGTLEGSFGPKSVMGSALAAYTPNIPWPRYGCEQAIRRNGEGTSSATPQVAAAVALWFEKYKGVLRKDWSRVEAVCNALFRSAKKGDQKHFGNGILQAAQALRIKPVLGLPKSERSKNSFAFLRLITGLGVVEPTPREEMFNLEIAQRLLVNPELQEIVPDPEGTDALEGAKLKRFLEAVIEDPGASIALRRHVASRYPVAVGQPLSHKKEREAVVPKAEPACPPAPAMQEPAYRRVRVYALDPGLAGTLETAGINEVALEIRWEALDQGPRGEYLTVEDVDADGNKYDPVDLNDPRLLVQDGWAPSEGNPQFHQQMVYAVAMKTIEHFELALGRPVLWRPRPVPDKPYDDSHFIQRLPIHPHALRQANAYYSPQDVALRFGYFDAAADDPGDHMPGSRVYSCLSHDIVAHETTHAILDGTHRRFNEPTNPDVLALHEGFADIVALFQHFTMREVLEHAIRRTRGNLEAESMLGSLAIQFGQASGRRGALREAIGRLEDGVWRRFEPDPADLEKRVEPHARGAILVGAVFDAFLMIYKARIADLLRLSTGGTGVLPAGAIHPDLVRRLAEEATKSARHVLTICIRALDYLPQVDVTFFEYLRGLITADYDLVSDDRHNYRVAFVEAFRRRGIYPLNMRERTEEIPRTLSVDTLLWEGAGPSDLTKRDHKTVERAFGGIIESLKEYSDESLYLADRKSLFDVTRARRRALKQQLAEAFEKTPRFAEHLGLDPERKSLEVHELRAAMRASPDGRHIPQVIVGLTQSRQVKLPGRGRRAGFPFRGGATLVVDLTVPEVKYVIAKRVKSEQRAERTATFVGDMLADPLRAAFFGPDVREPFAALHALADWDSP